MLNHSQKQNSVGNFWFGFLLGIFLGVAGLFLFGTKKGRHLLKKTLESTEELENYLAEIMAEIEEKTEENRQKLENKLSTAESNNNVNTVLQKIRSVL